MTQEEKQELWVAICGYLPHGVIFDYNEQIVYGFDWLNIQNQILTTTNQFSTPIEKVRPYLRPLSSMTPEERDIFRSLGGVMSYSPQHDTWALCAFSPEAYDYLNANYFDYRGLIKKGLALEATKGMYETT